MSVGKGAQQDADEKQEDLLLHHWGMYLGPLGLREDFEFLRYEI